MLPSSRPYISDDNTTKKDVSTHTNKYAMITEETLVISGQNSDGFAVFLRPTVKQSTFS